MIAEIAHAAAHLAAHGAHVCVTSGCSCFFDGTHRRSRDPEIRSSDALHSGDWFLDRAEREARTATRRAAWLLAGITAAIVATVLLW